MRPQRLILISVLALVPSLGHGHHSFAAEFIREIITIEGVVTEVWFKNPHVAYRLEVVNERGETELWDTRGGSATNLQRSGWTQESISVGDRVVMTGNRGRDGKKLLDIRTVRLPDGSVLPPGGVEEYRHTN
jgi:hypothetical protein